MPSDDNIISVRFSNDFEVELYKLSKRYRNIRSDIQPIIEELQVGQFNGDRIAGLGEEYFVYKLRVRNSNIKKGKSAGYRLIYQVESPTSVILIAIYSKSDREDIGADEILEIISESDND
jgi:mRNA-degrading endonuclease RelE of RelBE toxin-antitoxin system